MVSPTHPPPPKADDLIEVLMGGLRETAQEVVPWFLEHLPPAYFQDTGPATRRAHLRAVLAARASGLPLRLTLQSEEGDVWTFIREGDRPGLLAELVRRLPKNRALRSAKVHTSQDGQLILDVFTLGEASERFDPEDAGGLAPKLLDIEALAEGQGVDPAALAKHLASCAEQYLWTVTPIRVIESLQACAPLRATGAGTEDTVVRCVPDMEAGLWRLTVASAGADKRRLFELVGSHLGRCGVPIRRAYADAFRDADGLEMSQLVFVVEADQDGLSEALLAELPRLKWLPRTALELAERKPQLGLMEAELLVALAHLAHASLARVNAYAFTRDRILRLLERHVDVSAAVVELFTARFAEGPGAREREAQRRAEAASMISARVDTLDGRRVFAQLLEVVELSLKTNYFNPQRYALSIRLAPEVHAGEGEAPFGVIFVHGAAFDAYHVRFRDIARGGVRVVAPRGLEAHALEADRLFDEAYGLAHAQQLKNKDIPEGGSKAVILVEPGASIERSVRAFGDAVLDLLVPGACADRYGQAEYLYLGPDENISPRLIEWIVDRAGQRGYPLASAFMSSKPGAGINHKVYGVTSEGVTVFLEEALRAVGIDPRKQSFSVTLTGGPDGDVAGNEIKILHREYGDHVRVVGVADGSGAAEDPDGLDMETLLSMVERSEPIAAFDRARLGPKGQLKTLDEPGGPAFRNEMHNRVRADAFVPAGGRPATINGRNWQRFVGEDGAPAAKVIVEGANLFLTPEARARLGEAGVLIVKDSSANKCGVICSSYEIVASMILEEPEFLEIKPRFVEQVLTRLRSLAAQEARLLFTEWRRRQAPLPELSVEVSRVILRAADAIRARLPELDAEDRARADALVQAHLPPVLVEAAGERITQRVPENYRHEIIASSLSTRVVYREGLDLMAGADESAVADTAVRYLRRQTEVDALLRKLDSGDPNVLARAAELLSRGGARAALMLDTDRR